MFDIWQKREEKCNPVQQKENELIVSIISFPPSQLD